MEWIFNGIGTAIVSFILGVVAGIAGDRFYTNKQMQKAGKNSNQIISGENEGTISIDKIYGDKIISNNPDEFDICNFSNYTATQIENVITKGNNETRRKWCLELILNEKQDYLILKCINKMDDNEEKYILLRELSERNFENSEYFLYICKSISNAVYQTKAIKLCITKKLDEYIEIIFSSIENNRYIFKALIEIYEYNEDIFKRLYDNGNCFDNMQYNEKLIGFLEEKEREK